MNLHVNVTVLFYLCILYVCSAKIYFEENFSDDAWDKKWVHTKHQADGKEFGEFVRTAGKFYHDEARKGIQTSQDARFYAISRRFDKFTNEGKKLVIQFTVKHEQNIDCGGGYIKLFDCSLDPKNLHGETPYLIMFGPDICGHGTKKVHAILNYNGKNVLVNKEIRCKDDVYTHAYTFVINPDNTYEVLIDGERVEGGELEADWDLLPPKTIKDPAAKKPEDWDDRATIPDPTDVKPEDWEQPEHIADPEASKPEDWDDEMDGEWEAPQVDNPDYKGEWTPKQIDNPAYKGPWIHPEIANPEYEAVADLYRHKEICGVGFDLWQVKAGSIFGDVLITDDLEVAKARLADLSAIQEGEKKMKEEQDKAEREAASAKKETEEEEAEEDEEEEEGRIPQVEEPEHEEL